ncbi:cytochrome c biogenesis protein CcmE, partial [Acinetobacter baumannii]|nr:cytochrome c biogenesis protein CcmE [Acinetobacter baumannii]
MLGLAAWLVISAFRENLVFFYTPTQIAQGEAPSSGLFRMGGMVEEGSVKRHPDGMTVSFAVTDMNRTVPVHYQGALPDLFKEGKGVV